MSTNAKLKKPLLLLLVFSMSFQVLVLFLGDTSYSNLEDLLLSILLLSLVYNDFIKKKAIFYLWSFACVAFLFSASIKISLFVESGSLVNLYNTSPSMIEYIIEYYFNSVECSGDNNTTVNTSGVGHTVNVQNNYGPSGPPSTIESWKSGDYRQVASTVGNTAFKTGAIGTVTTICTQTFVKSKVAVKTATASAMTTSLVSSAIDIFSK